MHCIARLSSAFPWIVPWVQKVFLFFLIPDSSWCGLLAKKCGRMMFYLAWPFCLAIFSLTWNSNTRVADQTFFLSC